MCSIYILLTHISVSASYVTQRKPTELLPEVSVPPISALNANSKRQCYFLIVSQFFLLPEPPAPPTCPSYQIAVLAKWSIPPLPIFIHITISLSALAVSTRTSGVCSCVCVIATVFVCSENDAVSCFWSPLPDRSAQSRNILCICMSDVVKLAVIFSL